MNVNIVNENRLAGIVKIRGPFDCKGYCKLNCCGCCSRNSCCETCCSGTVCGYNCKECKCECKNCLPESFCFCLNCRECKCEFRNCLPESCCCCLNCRDCQIECKKNNCCSGSDSGTKLNSCGNLCIKKRYSCEILLPNQEIKYFIFYNSCLFSCNCGKCLRKSCGLSFTINDISGKEVGEIT